MPLLLFLTSVICIFFVSRSVLSVMLILKKELWFYSFLFFTGFHLDLVVQLLTESLWPHGLQHAGLPRPPLSPGARSCSYALRHTTRPWAGTESKCPESFALENNVSPPILESPWTFRAVIKYFQGTGKSKQNHWPFPLPCLIYIKCPILFLVFFFYFFFIFFYFYFFYL